MIEKKTVFYCDHTDIEQIILKHFGNPYEIISMEEVGSSQYAAVIKVTVEKSLLYDYELEAIQTLKDGNPEQFMLNYILTDLANKEKLEEGDYIISVNW